MNARSAPARRPDPPSAQPRRLPAGPPGTSAGRSPRRGPCPPRPTAGSTTRFHGGVAGVPGCGRVGAASSAISTRLPSRISSSSVATSRSAVTSAPHPVDVPADPLGDVGQRRRPAAPSGRSAGPASALISASTRSAAVRQRRADGRQQVLLLGGQVPRQRGGEHLPAPPAASVSGPVELVQQRQQLPVLPVDDVGDAAAAGPVALLGCGRGRQRRQGNGDMVPSSTGGAEASGRDVAVVGGGTRTRPTRNRPSMRPTRAGRRAARAGMKRR